LIGITFDVVYHQIGDAPCLHPIDATRGPVIDSVVHMDELDCALVLVNGRERD
jgi:hypothetical protein